jgi:hypothetical protein
MNQIEKLEYRQLFTERGEIEIHLQHAKERLGSLEGAPQGIRKRGILSRKARYMVQCIDLVNQRIGELTSGESPEPRPPA